MIQISRTIYNKFACLFTDYTTTSFHFDNLKVIVWAGGGGVQGDQRQATNVQQNANKSYPSV